MDKVGKHIESEMKFQASLRGLKVDGISSYDNEEYDEEVIQSTHDYAMKQYKERMNGSRS